MLSLRKKEEVVYKLQKKFNTALSAVVASINGIKSNSINELRKEARNFDVSIRVAPNTLLCRSVVNTPYECLLECFVGNSIIAFSMKKPSDAARIFVQFTKDHESFVIRGAVFENKLVKLDQMGILANLPSYKESVIQLVSVLKISSIGRLINILKILSNRRTEL